MTTGRINQVAIVAPSRIPEGECDVRVRASARLRKARASLFVVEADNNNRDTIFDRRDRWWLAAANNSRSLDFADRVPSTRCGVENHKTVERLANRFRHRYILSGLDPLRSAGLLPSRAGSCIAATYSAERRLSIASSRKLRCRSRTTQQRIYHMHSRFVVCFSLLQSLLLPLHIIFLHKKPRS